VLESLSRAIGLWLNTDRCRLLIKSINGGKPVRADTSGSGLVIQCLITCKSVYSCSLLSSALLSTILSCIHRHSITHHLYQQSSVFHFTNQHAWMQQLNFDQPAFSYAARCAENVRRASRDVLPLRIKAYLYDPRLAHLNFRPAPRRFPLRWRAQTLCME